MTNVTIDVTTLPANVQAILAKLPQEQKEIYLENLAKSQQQETMKQQVSDNDIWFNPRLPQDCKVGESVKWRIRLLPNRTPNSIYPHKVTRRQYRVSDKVSSTGKWEYIPSLENKKECPMNNFFWTHFNQVLKPLAKEERASRRIATEVITDYVNILVLKDEQNPENEGKFLVYGFKPQLAKSIASSLEMNKFTESSLFDVYHGHDITICLTAKNLNGNIVPEYTALVHESLNAVPADLVDTINTKGYELENVIPEIKRSLEPDFEQQIIEKMHEVFGRSVDGVYLPTLKGERNESNSEVNNTQELLVETNPKVSEHSVEHNAVMNFEKDLDIAF